MTGSTTLCLLGYAFLVAMTAWCVLSVRRWRRVAEDARRREQRGFGRCRAADVQPGDLVFVWAYVLRTGEWKHGTVAAVEHDRLDAEEVQLVRIRLEEGASFSVKPFAPAWVLPRVAA
jgi:hypothetical protein